MPRTNEQDALKRLKNAVEYSGRHRSPFYVSEKLNEINRSIQKGHLETIDAKEWWGCYHHSEWEKVTRDVISRF